MYCLMIGNGDRGYSPLMKAIKDLAFTVHTGCLWRHTLTFLSEGTVVTHLYVKLSINSEVKADDLR